MHLSTQTTLLIVASSARLVFGGPLQFEVVGSRTARTYHDVNVRRATSSLKLENKNDIRYTAKITLGGGDETYNIELDTGSSDFWVTPQNRHVANSEEADKEVAGTRVDRTSNGAPLPPPFPDKNPGRIRTADLDIVGFKIPKQSFIEITDGEDATPGGGVLGLSINKKSKIMDALKSDSDVGFNPIHRIFEQEKDLPRIMTMLLGRSSDPSGGDPGTFTVGAVLDEYDDVENQPKLEFDRMHHRFWMDTNAVIAKGKTVEVKSTVDKGRESLAAFLNSRSSTSQVPPDVAQAFYESYSGAEEIELEGFGDAWVVPCKQEVQIAFKLGGRKIPIHPLDATLTAKQLGIDEELRDKEGQEMCIGSFQPYNHRPDNSVDVLLGMPFLRNVYSLTNFGDSIFWDETTAGYVQLLPTTDVERAHQDFVTVRGKGTEQE